MRYPKTPKFKTLRELCKYSERKKWVNPRFQTRLKPQARPKRCIPAIKDFQTVPHFLQEMRWKKTPDHDFPV